jgi:hypothetical protein
MKWKCISASVQGTSHLSLQTECQDSHLFAAFDANEGQLCFAFVSDGAGSASRSARGSQLLCETMKERAVEFFSQEGRISLLNERLIANWIESFRSEIVLEAESIGVPPREFACTLLGAVVGPASAAFFQVGDGAIIYSVCDGVYRLVFWPERGEYENTTYFATEANFMEQLQFACLNEPIREIALLSDGLQRLALDYRTKEAHQPFFKGFFPILKVAATTEIPELNSKLAAYLNSPKVNDRTDDDKTLVLAATAD